MLVTVLLAALMVVVFCLIALDVRRTPKEELSGPAAGHVPEFEREVVPQARPANTEATRQELAGTGETAAVPDTGPAQPYSGLDPSIHGHRRPDDAPDASRKTSHFALKNWRVRSRLYLLVFIPTVTAVVLGALRVASSVDSALSISPSSPQHGSAVTSVIVDGTVLFLVLALSLVSTTLVGRSLVQPLRRLRTGALEVAGLSLPETVRRMSEGGEDVPLEVDPIDVDSLDEIGEVARAFDQVHREALRLAATEAALRGNINAMFVNLSRRSQSLIERQIGLIDNLEQGEQDSERLANLFQMDHLATRMRRNSENLLVLAGHTISRRWNQPVALIDVLRAAVSEIEQYERITLNVQSGIAVRGQAVNDVVHLLAELAENATSFSAAEMPVAISGHLLSSGGVLLDITDQGVGMGAEEMAHANWQLDNPPVVDVAVSRRMGLFVVGRLAARHGVRVRLRPAASGGLTALVWLPDEVISRDTTHGIPPGQRQADISDLAEISAGSLGGEPANGNRSAMEHEVDAARSPKFASLTSEEEDPGILGPRRVPGGGPRPGADRRTTTATGPLPVFRTSPQPALPQEREPFTTGPQPAVRDKELVIGSQPEMEGEQPGAIPQTAGGDQATDFADNPAAEDSQLVDSGSWPEPNAPIGTSNGGNGQKHGARGGNGSSGFGWERAALGDRVIVPPAGPVGTENRLPIFEAVESDWFRRGRSGIGSREPAKPAEDTTESPAWESPADQGWEAAEAVSSPSSAGVTTAGLPKRVPRANLVPGSVAAEAQPTAPARSAEATRARFASFQRGLREGRAVGGADDSVDGEDQSS